MKKEKAVFLGKMGLMILVPLCAWALNNTFTNSTKISSLEKSEELRGNQLNRMEDNIDKILEKL